MEYAGHHFNFRNFPFLQKKPNELFARIKLIHCSHSSLIIIFIEWERKRRKRKNGYFSPLNTESRFRSFHFWIPIIIIHSNIELLSTFILFTIEKFPTFHWNVKYVNFFRHHSLDTYNKEGKRKGTKKGKIKLDKVVDAVIVCMCMLP